MLDTKGTLGVKNLMKHMDRCHANTKLGDTCEEDVCAVSLNLKRIKEYKLKEQIVCTLSCHKAIGYVIVGISSIIFHMNRARLKYLQHLYQNLETLILRLLVCL